MWLAPLLGPAAREARPASRLPSASPGSPWNFPANSPGTPLGLLSEQLGFAAVDKALQQLVEQIIGPRTDRPVLLPGCLLGDLQPCGIVLKRQRLNLQSGLGKRLDCRFLSFPLGRFKKDVGDRGRILERLPFLLAQALPNRFRHDDRCEDGERAIAAANSDKLRNFVDTEAHHSLEGVLHDGELAPLQRGSDLAQWHWQYARSGSSENNMVVIAAAAARGKPLYRLGPGNGPRSADHAAVEPPPRQNSETLFRAELLELGLELRPLEQTC